MAQRSIHSVHLDDAGETRVVTRAPARERWSWALYDFANTIFSMNVISLFFGAWLITDLGSSNTLYALAGGLASLLVFISVPLLGAVSDARRVRKSWVVGFTLAACVGCAMIGILGQETVPLRGEAVIGATSARGLGIGFGDVKWVLLAFVLANFAYQAAQPFYNAMLASLVPANEQGRMSGTGVALGYLGSIVGVILATPFFTGDLPTVGALGEGTMRFLRAIPFTEHAGRVSTFVPTALLFLLFSLPFMIFCRDREAPRPSTIDWRRPFSELRDTIREGRQYPGVLRFVLTSFVYQDAVGTINSFMAVYAVVAVGFDGSSLSTVFLALTVPAIFGSFFYGWLTDRVGPKRALGTTIAIWMVLLLALALTPGKAAFWIIGVAIGLNFGGVNAVERPMLLSLVPDVHAARFFSLLLLSARAAAVVGPIIWAVLVDSLQGQLGAVVANRSAVAVVGLMFAIAWWLLRRVPDRRPGTRVVA